MWVSVTVSNQTELSSHCCDGIEKIRTISSKRRGCQHSSPTIQIKIWRSSCTFDFFCRFLNQYSINSSPKRYSGPCRRKSQCFSAPTGFFSKSNLVVCLSTLRLPDDSVIDKRRKVEFTLPERIKSLKRFAKCSIVPERGGNFNVWVMNFEIYRF